MKKIKTLEEFKDKFVIRNNPCGNQRIGQSAYSPVSFLIPTSIKTLDFKEKSIANESIEYSPALTVQDNVPVLLTELAPSIEIEPPVNSP